MADNKTLIHRIWTIVYAFFYPVLMLFSATFLLLTQMLSYPSHWIRKILNKINLPDQK